MVVFVALGRVHTGAFCRTQRLNMIVRGSARPRFRLGQEGEHSGERAARCDPTVFAAPAWEKVFTGS